MWPFKKNEINLKKQPTTSLHALHELVQQRAKLQLQFSDSNEIASSFVLKIEDTSNPPYLVIDELFPQAINSNIKPGQRLHIEAFFLGKQVQFQTSVMKVEREKGQTLYLCSLPDHISKEQARGGYRVSINKLKKVPVTLMISHRPTLQGTLSDISNTGAGIIIQGALRQPFSKGDIIEYCSIKLEGDEAIRGKLIIRRIEYSHASNETNIGAEFINLETQYQKTLEKFVAAMQRLERRKSIATP